MSTARYVTIIAGLLVASCASNPARSSLTVPLEIPEPPPRVAMDPVQAVIVGTPVRPNDQSQRRYHGRPALRRRSRQRPRRPQLLRRHRRRRPSRHQSPRARLRRRSFAPPARAAARRPPHKCATASCARKQKLDSIDRRRLNAGKRTDYDSARRFLSQAEAAVKENNLLLAESSVEKAETLADGLK